MGSSGEDPNKGIDASVGGLVWIRRRNGSWWPGRILGPDELPKGCLSTPRLGTPVKLLGREDASVDWYNLEKSKRVKAFRCGEYNNCIEKAKASASHLSKKAVKYARRDDAILHALKLESAQLGKDCPNFSARCDTCDEEQRHVVESPSPFYPSEESEDVDEDLSGSEDKLDSTPELSQSGVSFEEPDYLDATREVSKRRRTPNESEDDGIEGVKRMKGLKDLGMGVASSPKRKRSQAAHVHEFLKRKNRRRTLTKVLECTAMVTVPVVCEKLSSPTGSSVLGASESKVSGLESNESKINSSLVVNNSDSTGVSCKNVISLNTSGRAADPSPISKPKENEISSTQSAPVNESFEMLFDVPLIEDEKNYAGLLTIVARASQKTQFAYGTQSSQSSHDETVSLGNEEHNESGSTSSGTGDIHDIRQKIDKGTSEWQLKGKRNSRLRRIDIDDGTETYVAGINQDGFLAGSRLSVDSSQVGGPLVDDGGSCHLKSEPITDIKVDELHGWNWNAPQRESHPRGSATEMAAPQRLLPYRQSRFTVNPKYDSFDYSLRHHTASSRLYDVPVEVKASYRPQHVPYISLMSKLHGQPITGHPLTVEVLDDGFCDDLLSLSECHSSSSESDYSMRNVSTFHGVAMIYERRPRGRPPSKHRSLLAHGSPTKSLKSRKNMLLSKKIRKLSSLTGSHRQSRERKKPVADKLKGPSIACVPVKVVFSRLIASLNS